MTYHFIACIRFFIYGRHIAYATFSPLIPSALAPGNVGNGTSLRREIELRNRSLAFRVSTIRGGSFRPAFPVRENRRENVQLLQVFHRNIVQAKSFPPPLKRGGRGRGAKFSGFEKANLRHGAATKGGTRTTKPTLLVATELYLPFSQKPAALHDGGTLCFSPCRFSPTPRSTE